MAAFGCVDEAFKRIHSHRGILGIMVINGDGVPLRSTLDSGLTTQYAALLSYFTSKVIFAEYSAVPARRDRPLVK